MTRSKKGPCYNMVCNMALFLVSMTRSKKRAMSQTWFYLFWRIHCEQFARLVRECSHGGEPWYNKGSFHVDFFLERVISRALFAWLFFWTSNGSSSWVFLNFIQVSQGGEPFSELVQVCHDGEAYDKNTFVLALAEWEIWWIRYQHFEHLFHEYWHVIKPYYIKDHL